MWSLRRRRKPHATDEQTAGPEDHLAVGREGPEDSGPDRDVEPPDPDAPGKPDSPGDLTKPSWLYVLRKTVREFSKDQCTDLAAALTYYSILALFPAAIALLSLVGLVGQGPKTVDTLLQILSDVGATSAADTLEPTLTRTQQHTQRRAGLRRRPRSCPVVGIGLCGRLRPRHEPDLRGR